MTLREVIKKQFEYCLSIKDDILRNGKSKEVQEHAMKYAEIESPIVGGTDAEWIRISYGDIYIFLDDDGGECYQLDPLGEYGGELINVTSVNEFYNKFAEISDEKLEEYHYEICDDGNYSEDLPKVEYKMYEGR